MTTVALGPLSRSDTLDLVQALARPGGDDAAAAGLSEEVWRTSGGNPFVVIEAMRGAPAHEALSPGLEGLSLPERVRDIPGRQLDRLGERSRELSDWPLSWGASSSSLSCSTSPGLARRRRRGEWRS